VSIRPMAAFGVRVFDVFDVRAEERERAAALPGDEIVSNADVVMDRGFTVRAAPREVWPWFVQLGKKRAGWYLPRGVERLLPPRRRALWRIEPGLQSLAVGDVIPDWGGSAATFEVAAVDQPSTIVYRSRRGRTNVSWAIVLSPGDGGTTRVHLRLRLSPVRRRRLAEVGGGFVDRLTIAGLAGGLRERVSGPPAAG
jgi:hypothetical protein